MAKSSGLNSDALTEKLSCGICFEIFNDSDRLPKAPPCMHTLCRKCSLGAINNTCPTCRSPIGDVDELKTNYALLDLLPLLESPEPARVDAPPMCSVHKRSPISHYCMDCHKAFCDKCFAATVRKDRSHFGHTIIEYAELVELQAERKKELAQKIKELEDNRAQIEHAFKEQAFATKLTERKSQLKEKISELANDLHIMVDVWQADTNCNVEAAFTQCLSSVETKAIELRNKLAEELEKLHEVDEQLSKGASMKESLRTQSASSSAWDEDWAALEHLAEPAIEVTEADIRGLPRLVCEGREIGSEATEAGEAAEASGAMENGEATGDYEATEASGTTEDGEATGDYAATDASGVTDGWDDFLKTLLTK